MECCYCINLRTGATLIGMSDIISGLMCVNYAMLDNIHSSIYAFLTLAVLHFFSGICLLGGTINRNHDNLFIKIFFSWVMLVATIIDCITFIIASSNMTMDVEGGLAGVLPLALAGYLLTISVKIYFWIVVLVFYRSFTQERILDTETAYMPLEIDESIDKDNVVVKETNV